MRVLPQLLFAALALNASGAGPVEMSHQTLIISENVDALRFVDIDGDGRGDLLAMDGVEKRLLHYHQRSNGFANAPDQIIPLPPQIAWVSLCDVDAHPGLELLMSTATGMVYSRQDGGLFESDWRTLVTARQVFTNAEHPLLLLLTTNKPALVDSIPVISEGQAVVYRRNSTYEWKPEPPVSLDAKRAYWWAYGTDSEWGFGSHPSYSLRLNESVRAKAEPEPDKEPENDTIRKIKEDMGKTAAAGLAMIDRVDVNGDGREDLVLWQCSGKLALKTDIYLFLRGADQKLPERPTQILHCRGFPIALGPKYDWSPVHDLNGDGIRELVMLELNATVASASGIVEALLSRGMDWSLTVRPFHQSAFAGSPDVSVPVKMLLPAQVLAGWPISLQGDFNGDGRLDLLVRRSDTQWNIYLSTTDGHWFAPQPALTFSAPARGYLEIIDPNGDGLSDIIWHQPDDHRFSIFMTPSRPGKGRSP